MAKCTLVSAIRELVDDIEGRAASLDNLPYYTSIELSTEERAAFEDLYRLLYLRVRGVPGRIYVGYDVLANGGHDERER